MVLGLVEETSQTFSSAGGPGIDFCTLKLVSLNACVFRFFLAEGWLALEGHSDAVEMRRMRQLRQSVSIKCCCRRYASLQCLGLACVFTATLRE